MATKRPNLGHWSQLADLRESGRVSDTAGMAAMSDEATCPGLIRSAGQFADENLAPVIVDFEGQLQR